MKEAWKQKVADKGDSNFVHRNDDEEDDEHDCEVVSCNDSQEQNVDRGQLGGLDERPSRRALHSLRRDTFPSEGECVSGVGQPLVERGRQTDAVNEHSKRSSAVSGELM